jgi:hypothetical protein
MIIDNVLVLSDEQAVTESAASANQLNFGEDGEGKGEGVPLKVKFVVLEDFATCTSVQFSVQESEDNAAADGYEDIVVSRAIPVAELVKGATFELTLPPDFEQYLQGYYTVDGDDATAGKVSAFIVSRQ